MSWKPGEMTYGEMERAQRGADLCRACRHREVCPVPGELARREGWYLSVATCAHYEPLDEARHKTAAVEVAPEGDHLDEQYDQEIGHHLELYALECAVGWSQVVDAHARTLADMAERDRKAGLIDAEQYAQAQHAARFAAREMAAARRALEKARDEE